MQQNINLLNDQYSVELRSENEILIVTNSQQEIATNTTFLVKSGAQMYQFTAAGGLEE